MANLNQYRKTLAAASSAANASHLMSLAALEADAPPRDALEQLADALKLAIEAFGDDREDNQLLGAVEKWLSEQGL
jgi:hypothetical protein